MFPVAYLPFSVTSLAEVWIEILYSPANASTASSLPLRKCGLKYSIIILDERISWSLPLRKCGLKCLKELKTINIHCHFPCGSVD